MAPRFPLFFLLVLTGCSAGQDYAAPAPGALGVPAQFQNAVAATTPTDLSRWWQQLGDPALTQLIETALIDNPDLQIAAARVKEAQANRRAARGAQLPQVKGTADARSDGSGSATQDTYSGDLTATLDPDLFGSQRRAVEAATADEAASVAGVNDTRVTLVASVAEAYLDWRLAQQRLLIAQDNLASQRQSLQFVRWQAKAGSVSQLDLEQAIAAAAQTEAQIPAYETSKAQALGQLAILLGRTTAATEPLLTGKSYPMAQPTLLVGIPAEVLRQRPDVQQAERQLAAATARVGEAKANQYPAFTLSGSIGLDALDLPSILSGATITRTLIGALAATLFDGGQLSAQVDVRSAQEEEALLSYKSTVIKALEDVETALITYVRQRERTRSLAQAATAARSAQQLADIQYRAGSTSYINLLDAQRTRLSAEDALAQAKSAELSYLVDLYRALGGGWDHDDNTGGTHERH